MYFVGTGSAFAKKKDKFGREKVLGKKLEPGSHFGDIALFYGCPRTATVISGDFSTVAKLSRDSYRQLV